MKLVFLTNLVNHHQIPLADEFYKILGPDYVYIAYESLPEGFKKGGYPEISRPYIVKAYQGEKERELARQLIQKADVVINSYDSKLVDERVAAASGLTFTYSERWIKNPIKLLDPRSWTSSYRYHTKYRHKPLFFLCASAFAAKDAALFGAYPRKCYKWGYFPAFAPFTHNRPPKIRIMSVARFLKWKHHELQIQAARILKDQGLDFSLDLYGSGEEEPRIRSLIDKLRLENTVSLKGNLPNAEILQEMAHSHIFIHTADRNEGWGAVINEAMSQGCAVVASDAIGSAPFLIEQGVNGWMFRNGKVNDLADKLKQLLEHPEQIEELGSAAAKTMQTLWSPATAAQNFVRLCQNLLDSKPSDIERGPCSPAR